VAETEHADPYLKGLALKGLGDCYVDARGVTADAAKGHRLYEDAAECGVAEAAFNVGLYHDDKDFNFHPGPVDFPKAAAFYMKAVDLGYVPAMTNLGLLYVAGDVKEPAAAYGWGLLSRAAALGERLGRTGTSLHEPSAPQGWPPGGARHNSREALRREWREETADAPSSGRTTGTRPKWCESIDTGAGARAGRGLARPPNAAAQPKPPRGSGAGLGRRLPAGRLRCGGLICAHPLGIDIAARLSAQSVIDAVDARRTGGTRQAAKPGATPPLANPPSDRASRKPADWPFPESGHAW
jgi:hypothetical protein